jgi:hypothetical protein
MVNGQALPFAPSGTHSPDGATWPGRPPENMPFTVVQDGAPGGGLLDPFWSLFGVGVGGLKRSKQFRPVESRLPEALAP